MLSIAMKPVNPDFSVACERLAERALQVERGTLLTFPELERLTGLPRNVLYQAIIRVNVDLLNAKRLLINVRGQGYLLSDVGEHMDHAHKRKLRAARQHTKGFRELESIDVSLLSADQKKHYQQRLALMGTLAALSRKHTVRGIQHSIHAVQHQQRSLEVQDDLRQQLAALQASLQKALK